MNAPPSRGPTTLAIPYMPPMKPVYTGLFSSGDELANIISAPENKPEAPRPAMARPTMRAIELGATPQISEPTSKMKRVSRNIHLILKKVYSRPKKSWKADKVSR